MTSKLLENAAGTTAFWVVAGLGGAAVLAYIALPATAKAEAKQKAQDVANMVAAGSKEFSSGTDRALSWFPPFLVGKYALENVLGAVADSTQKAIVEATHGPLNTNSARIDSGAVKYFDGLGIVFNTVTGNWEIPSLGTDSDTRVSGVMVGLERLLGGVGEVKIDANGMPYLYSWSK